MTAAGREIFLENSNDLLWEERSTIIGKTGYTGDARHCFVAAIETDRGPLYAAVLGARSRAGLWRSTQTLAEIVMHPELEQVMEKARPTQESRKSMTKKRRPVSPGTDWADGIADLQMSRLQGVFSQRTQNN
jgi:D-alanyl-D-alanine carboxypeptidase